MTVTCQLCGTANPDTATFCEGCGVELPKGAQDQSAGAPVPAASPAAVSPEPAQTPEATQSPATPEASSSAPENQAANSQPLPGEAATPVAGAVDPFELSAPPVASTPSAADAAAASLASSPADAQVTPAPAGASTPEAAPAVPAVDPGASAASAPAPEAAGAAKTGPAKLGVKKYGTATGDFIPLQGERLTVGRFDPSSGPVDIDLTALGSPEHISRRHAELYKEGERWFVRDLGSTNGVFVKRAGQGSFSPRLQQPEALSDGDEVAFGNVMLGFHQD